MKITGLKITNVGILEDVDLKLDKPLILFYGEIRQGKSTILNAIRWAFGGAFPSDIIRHGQTTARVEIAFEGGMIRRDWYVAKDKTTKAKDLVFVRGGKPVPSPVNELKRLLNPFLLDQDHLRKMTETERKAYFAEVFAIDTTALDTELYNVARDASDLRAKIKGYGEIDLTPVEVIDPAPLREELKQMKQAHEEACKTVDKENEAAIKRNSDIQRGKEKLEEIDLSITELKSKLEALEKSKATIKDWLAKNPILTLRARPDALDTSSIDAKLMISSASAVKAEQYRANLKRAEQRKADEEKLSKLSTREREIKKQKIAKLKGISESCGIKDLSFDEAGTFTYQGTQAGMLSTSQIMKLSSELSALYPEGLGIDLIDRAESLGKSIFEFVSRAEEEKKTILATIVGEAPAKVPEHIGVFVVSNGKVEEQELGITP